MRPGTPGTWADSAFGAGAVEWVTDDAAGGWTMAPALDETSVYFERDLRISGGAVTASAQLLALDRVSGQVRWGRDIVTANNAAIVGDNIGAVWGGLVVANRSSGTQQFVFTYPGTSLSGNVAGDATRFYVLTHSGRAVALDGASGTVVWDTDLATNTRTTAFGATLAGDDLVVTLKYFHPTSAAPDSGIVVVVNRNTGSVRWRVGLDLLVGGYATVGEPAVVWGNRVIVRTERHRIVALDMASGALVWQYDAAYGSPTFGSSGLAVCDGRVITSTGELGLQALDALTGALLWKRGDLGMGSLLRLLCSHGTVLIPAGGLRLFDAATGSPIASYPLRELDPAVEEFYIANVIRDAQSVYVSTTRGFARFRAP